MSLIDFPGLEKALLDRADTLVPAWLPGGKTVAAEWVCADLSGGEGHSCSVNLKTGRFGDFAAGVQGGNLLDLYCAIHGLDRVPAARELMAQLGWTTSPTPAPPPRAPPPAPPPARPPAEKEDWQTVRPVPPHAPKVTFRHHHRLEADIKHVAEYRTGDDLHGYVVRFVTSEGGKDPIPRTWCSSSKDGASAWKWRTWDEPRPLYYPGHAHPAGRTVILVEGEKKADALQTLLDAHAPGVYCVVSWPGGCKAWKKADWSWLAGCLVLLWPDCDAKHEPLTADEKRQAGGDKLVMQVLQQAKPLLPREKQGGEAAMRGIGALLRDTHGCQVQMLPIPAPGEVADGWDCDDAINVDGWGMERVQGLFAQAYTLQADNPTPAAPAGNVVPLRPGITVPTQPPAGAGGKGGGDGDGGGADPPEGDDEFAAHLDYLCDVQKCERWHLAMTRKLIITALHKAPALKGRLGFNELTSAPCTTQAWPWRDAPGALAETDDLRLGDWLSSQYKLKAASRAALSEAIDTVADSHRFHPIRDWLKGLQHDGKPRLDKWLVHVLGKDPATMPPKLLRYHSLVGRYILLGLVARVMKPGCKFDYSPVFEGITGVGKSTLVQVLVGKDHFSDTHFDIGGGKDGMEQFDGLWGYELSELTAFKRADNEQVKQFFSSTVDRFRGAYGKYVQPHPRQLVIFCTTNKRRYLYDLTSQRRFWPVWIETRIRIEWLSKWREQLFAEAFAAWQAGERYFPSEEEEAVYFRPEQRKRLVETTVHARLYELLTREGAPAMEGRATVGLNQHATFVTLPELTSALGADPAKSTSLLESQIHSWLDAYGWIYWRETTGARRRGFRRPDVWPPEPDDEDEGTPPAGASPSPSTNQTTGEPPRAEPVTAGDDEPF